MAGQTEIDSLGIGKLEKWLDEIPDDHLQIFFKFATVEMKRRGFFDPENEGWENLESTLGKYGVTLTWIEVEDEEWDGWEEEPDDSWIEDDDDDCDHDGWESGRTPNDDRSDSMNPNSPSYNP